MHPVLYNNDKLQITGHKQEYEIRQANCTRISIYISSQNMNNNNIQQVLPPKSRWDTPVLHPAYPQGVIFSYYRTYPAVRTKSIKGSKYSDATELSDINTCEWIIASLSEGHIPIVCRCTCGQQSQSTPLATGGTLGSRV